MPAPATSAIPAEDLGDALHPTRMIRMGLEAMWSSIDVLPDAVAPVDPEVRQALLTISAWLHQAEEGQVRDQLTTRNYTIIRPVSLLDPPSPQAMADITAAVAVLHGHGLIITAPGE